MATPATETETNRTFSDVELPGHNTTLGDETYTNFTTIHPSSEITSSGLDLSGQSESEMKEFQ